MIIVIGMKSMMTVVTTTMVNTMMMAMTIMLMMIVVVEMAMLKMMPVRVVVAVMTSKTGTILIMMKIQQNGRAPCGNFVTGQSIVFEGRAQLTTNR